MKTPPPLPLKITYKYLETGISLLDDAMKNLVYISKEVTTSQLEISGKNHI